MKDIEDRTISNHLQGTVAMASKVLLPSEVGIRRLANLSDQRWRIFSGEPLSIEPPLRLLFILLNLVLILPYLDIEVTVPDPWFDCPLCFMRKETDRPLCFMLPRNSNLPTPMSAYSLQILRVFDTLP